MTETTEATADGAGGLPAGWVWTTIGEVTQVNPPRDVLTPDTPVSFVPMAAVEAATGRMNAEEDRQWASVQKGYTPFREGDVLFAKITPCMENGKCAIARGLTNGYGAGSTEFHVFRATSAVETPFLLQFLLQRRFRGEMQGLMQGAAGQLRVPDAVLRGAAFPLPPLPEQRRIIARIEELLSQVDAGVAGLRDLQKKLKRYRAAVLKAACEGTLVPTEADLARAEGRDYEPAGELLARVLTERRARWEADQLAKMRAKGAEPKDDRWKAKYEEPDAPDTSDLRDLPDGWVWTTLEQVAPLLAGFAFSSKTFQPTGTRLLKGINVRDEWLYEGEIDHWPSEDVGRFRKFELVHGDIVIAMDRPVYSSGSKATKVARLNLAWDGALLLQRVGKFQRSSFVDGGYLFAFLRGANFRQHLVLSQNGSQDGKDLPHVSAATIDAAAFPLPPAAEQKRIAAEVERRLSVLDQMEVALRDNLKRADRLRQAVLRDAFAGKLVPQDPADEPAVALLERIRAERAEAGAGRVPHDGRKANGDGRSSGQSILPFPEMGTAKAREGRQTAGTEKKLHHRKPPRLPQ